jgi:hypothetical protein
VRFRDQPVEVGERAEHRMDVAVVGNVIVELRLQRLRPVAAQKARRPAADQAAAAAGDRGRNDGGGDGGGELQRRVPPLQVEGPPLALKPQSPVQMNLGRGADQGRGARRRARGERGALRLVARLLRRALTLATGVTGRPLEAAKS